ncbi:bifunctional nuclease family protein [Ornithinicoccus hortensis]|uniref:BFN domain-containing protein n=1 Tax=Ornithinicoccus hortensis TaxID=82346 RepID=A0A542YT57_9MICO|nr:hypothetical protein FB467_2411 [Ornithinicoccus hortensis]
MLGVRVEMPSNNPIVLLRERDGQRYLPIWIAAPEATAIAYAQQGVTPPRPLTHDLMVTVLQTLGHSLDQVQITSMEDNIFYAVLVLDGGKTEISSRPSDAIALALRSATPIVATDSVLDAAGVTLAMEDEDEDEVERFREFLDNVSAEDFEEDAEGGPADPSADAPEESDQGDGTGGDPGRE